MSTIDNNPVETEEQNLDDFSADFFGQKEADPPTEATEGVNQEDDETEDDASLEQDTHVDDEDDDALAPDERDEDANEKDEEDQDEPEDSNAPKPKKNRFQERIDQLVRDREEERRERLALQAKLEELINKQNEPEPKKEAPKVDTPTADQQQDEGPQPGDLNEDGSEKYPLGEFDPAYIRDMAKHVINAEREAMKREQEQQEQIRREQEAAQALQEQWNQKLEPAKERYPDFMEKGEQLAVAFDGIDQAYGDYLTSTIMEMEHGPDVLYYLANNLDEAKAIVNSGARKATVALGRLEAKFADASEERKQARPKVSKAPEPPSRLNKGTSAVKPSVKGDEDDLESFEQVFFKKR